MLPRVVVRVRRAVRRLARRSGLNRSEGADNEVEWRRMLSRINERDAGAERRLAEAERALNRLGQR